MRTLGEWVLAASSDELRAVLEHRPDALAGAPLQSREDLARRLADVPGVLLVLTQLPRPAWQLLLALSVLGGRADVDELSTLLGADREDVETWRDVLAQRALVVPGGEDVLVANPATFDAVGSVPGLGRPVREIVAEVSAEELAKVVRRWGIEVPKRKALLVEAVAEHLRDPANVRRIVATAPEPTMTWLLAATRYGVQVAHAEVFGLEPPAPTDELHGPAAYRTGIEGTRWARAQGLAFATWSSYDGAVVPSEVSIALGGPLRLPFEPRPPGVATARVARRQVDSAAAAAMSETLGTLTAVLDHVRARPAESVKAGGVGARELARIAKAASAPVELVRLALETGGMLGLVHEEGRRVVVTGELDAWRGREPADRLLLVWSAWLDVPVHPTSGRDPDGNALPALGRGVFVPPVWRTQVLSAALESTRDADDEARAVGDLAGLAAAVRWADAEGPDEPDVATIWREATLLGLVALDAVTPAAADVLEGDAAFARARVADALPAVAESARIGSDLTVVVAGVPSTYLTDFLDLVAEREARGAASTWRLSPTSVRRAFDAGLTADDLLARLTRVSGAVPQAVEYLVHDVARRHGHVAVRPAASVLVVPDEALRAELLVAQSLRGLDLVPVDGAVLASSQDVATTLDRLRAAGYLPVETDTGGLRVLRGTVPDEPGAAGSPAVAPVELAPARPARRSGRGGRDVDEALRELSGAAGHDHELTRMIGAITPYTRRLADLDRRQLAWAVLQGLPIQLEYRSSSGGTTVRMVSGLGVLGGYVTGWCHLRSAERQFRLDGIQRAVPVVIGTAHDG